MNNESFDNTMGDIVNGIGSFKELFPKERKES